MALATSPHRRPGGTAGGAARPPAGTEGTGIPGLRGRGRLAALHAVGLLGFLGAGFLGRATVLDDSGLALLWPAGGVAASWLFLAPRSQRPVLLGVLGVAALAFNVTTGASLAISGAFAVSNVLQVLVFLRLVDRWCPELWGVRGDRPLAAVRPLTAVTLAAAGGAVLGVGAGQVLMELVPGGPTVGLALVWGGRNFAGLLSVFAVVHLVAYRLSGAERSTRVPPWEWSAMTAVTLLAYGPAFAQDALPLAFLPVVAVLWVGLRSDAVVAAAHALLGGAVAVSLTVVDRGPFSLVPDVLDRALVVQLFLTVVLVSGLYLSAAREERVHAAQDLAAERARAEQQAELLATALANVSDGVAVLGADGRVLDANPAARHLWGLLAPVGGELAGGTSLQHLDGSTVLPGRLPAERALRGEAVHGEELVLVEADGTRRTVSVHATPVRGAGPALVVSTVRDVTEERAQVDELSAFAAVVAHDLRGPLAAMQGWAELAQHLGAADPSVPQDLVLALDRLRAGSIRLGDLLDSLLVHATSRDRAVAREPVDLGALVSEVAAARGLERWVEVHPLPTVLGDVVMLRHLVDNLVANAVKFVADGVVPHVVVAGHRERGRVVLTVTDNGIGVPEEMRRAVFQRFQRVAGTGRQGTGLGLSICRTIAERHGGDITVGPGPDGTGSTFTVRLPDLAGGDVV